MGSVIAIYGLAEAVANYSNIQNQNSVVLLIPDYTQVPLKQHLS